MPAPSPLIIAAQSVSRLVKEEAYYRKELSSQKTRLEEERAKVTADADYNDNFMLKQHETAVKETEKVFDPLLVKIEDAVAKLEEQIALSESSGGASDDDLKKANEALASAKSLHQKEVEGETATKA